MKEEVLIDPYRIGRAQHLILRHTVHMRHMDRTYKNWGIYNQTRGRLAALFGRYPSCITHAYTRRAASLHYLPCDHHTFCIINPRKYNVGRPGSSEVTM